MTFGDAIKPLRVQEFEDMLAGQLCWHQEGATDRYCSQLPWSALNDAVNRLQLPAASGAVTLYLDGVLVDTRRFLASSSFGEAVTIDSGKLQGFLASGAVLVVNHSDQMFSFVAELTRSVEQELRARTTARLLVSWHQQRTSDARTYDHDRFVLQLDGRVQCRIHASVSAGTLSEGKARAIRGDDWISELQLEPGACLSIPRGTSHSIRALDGLTRFVILEVRRWRGEDLVEWLIQDLKTNAEVRMDLPVLDSATAQAAYAEALRQIAMRALTGDVVTRFVEYVDSQSPPPPFVDLSRCAHEHDSIAPDTAVRLSGARRLSFSAVHADRVTCMMGGQTWHCAASLLPALRRLSSDRPTTVGDLCAAMDSDVARTLKVFLLRLTAAGAVTVSRAAGIERPT